MSDRLENFIKNNKKEFEGFEPPENLWARIEKQLDEYPAIPAKKEPAVIRISVLIRAAATIIIIITAGLFLWRYQYQNTADISSINTKLGKQQLHYASLIEEKRSEIKLIEKQDPQLYKEFSSEIKAMDENYQKLKNDLSTSPNQEETVKAMIRNMQIQIQVLNQQLKVIEQVNQLKKEAKNETQSI